MAIILVVDDEVGIRELLSEILIDEGYDVRLAENAGAARRIRNELRPDLVLLDIWMPDMDGISLLKEWHAAGHLNMPVVMMSGHGTIDTAVEATRFGAFDFLEKPIALQKLLSAVQKALKHDTPPARPPLTLDAFGRSPSSRNSSAGSNRRRPRRRCCCSRARLAAWQKSAPARCSRHARPGWICRV
jgi:two-component system nitrogen regulation response regulator NtrX